jgi:UDP-N-acetylmuramoyl-L-alanyl-D-glutamate--2,6-diaminopimelate ligase
MQLTELLREVSYQLIQGNVQTEVTDVAIDTRKDIKSQVFVCLNGAVSDSHDFIDEIVKKGANAVVVERMVGVPKDVTVILVEDTKYVYSMMVAAYFGYPARELTTIGITGTKGKTTTTYIIKSVLEQAGYSTGLIGTIEAIIGDKRIASMNTTPDAYLIHKYLREMVTLGCKYVVMEVSSQGLKLHRTASIDFDYGIFTNIEPDHIGPAEHADFEEYMQCKGMLFRQCKVGIVNVDDEHVDELIAGHTCTIETFGLSEKAEVRAIDIERYQTKKQLGIKYRTQGAVQLEVQLPVPGVFSVYNSLAAIALCRHFDMPKDVLKQALTRVLVKGRMELVQVPGDYIMMIDYAHNALSLESLLLTLREYEPKRLICLFGCGGNRSKLRRYEMGEISSKLADISIVTSDNPRFEEPLDIIEDIKVGIAKGTGECIVIPDRKEAIRYCMDNAMEGDIIILAGKGHEDYQEIKGVKYHLDEREIIEDIMKTI